MFSNFILKELCSRNLTVPRDAVLSTTELGNGGEER